MRHLGKKQTELLRLMNSGAIIYAPGSMFVRRVIDDGELHKPFTAEFYRVNIHKLDRDGFIQEIVTGSQWYWYEIADLGRSYLAERT